MVRTPVHVLPIRSESGKRVFPIPDICDAIAYGMEQRVIAGAYRFAQKRVRTFVIREHSRNDDQLMRNHLHPSCPLPTG